MFGTRHGIIQQKARSLHRLQQRDNAHAQAKKGVEHARPALRRLLHEHDEPVLLRNVQAKMRKMRVPAKNHRLVGAKMAVGHEGAPVQIMF